MTYAMVYAREPNVVGVHTLDCQAVYHARHAEFFVWLVEAESSAYVAGLRAAMDIVANAFEVHKCAAEQAC
jgi:hypothetical protein